MGVFWTKEKGTPNNEVYGELILEMCKLSGFTEITDYHTIDVVKFKYENTWFFVQLGHDPNKSASFAIRLTFKKFENYEKKLGLVCGDCDKESFVPFNIFDRTNFNSGKLDYAYGISDCMQNSSRSIDWIIKRIVHYVESYVVAQSILS